MTSERPTEQRGQHANIRCSRYERNESHCGDDRANRRRDNAESESDECQASDNAQRAAGTTSQERSYWAPCECQRPPPSETSVSPWGEANLSAATRQVPFYSALGTFVCTCVVPPAFVR